MDEHSRTEKTLQRLHEDSRNRVQLHLAAWRGVGGRQELKRAEPQWADRRIMAGVENFLRSCFIWGNRGAIVEPEQRRDLV